MQTISAQDIVDTVREGLVVLDSQLTVVSANRSFYLMFAVSPEQTLGCRIYDLGDGQWNISALKILLEDILPQEQSVETFEVEHIFPDVGHKVVNINARKVYRLGNHVEHIVVAFHDVTDLRKEQRKAARAALITREIVDTIRDPMVVLDQDLRITTASRNFVIMFGDAEADLVGKRMDELKQGQWDLPQLRTLLEQVVPDETPFENFLVEDHFAGLGHRVFKLNARKIYVPGNHVTHLLLVFEDVTDTVAAERHRDLMTAELAHRIKNSLSVISAFVSFEIRRAAEPCVVGYQAMQTRINAIAGLYDVIARSNAFGPVDVTSYLNGIAESLRSSLLGDASYISIVVETDPLAIVADHAVSIGLLVNELATNAIKYAFPGGRGTITLAFQQRDGETVLSVEDDGRGYDGSAGSAGTSSGMGTRFIDAFVGQIGGSLARATSTAGTSVTVRLPATILAC